MTRTRGGGGGGSGGGVARVTVRGNKKTLTNTRTTTLFWSVPSSCCSSTVAPLQRALFVPARLKNTTWERNDTKVSFEKFMTMVLLFEFRTMLEV